MEKKVGSSEQLLANKEELVAKYYAVTKRSNKPQHLSKKERKILGIGTEEGRAKLSYVRISSRKVEIVLNLIRGKSIEEAFGILNHTPKAASEILIKLLKSAVANAVNKELDRESLYVAETYATQGPTLKRWIARARGSASSIKKRSSHILIVVKEREQ